MILYKFVLVGRGTKRTFLLLLANTLDMNNIVLFSLILFSYFLIQNGEDTLQDERPSQFLVDTGRNFEVVCSVD